MKTTLVILAAGMGSRYGGLKQLDAMGPNGETVLDFTVFDAVQAGFQRILFVIRKDFAQEFDQKVVQKYSHKIEVETVFQELDALPEGYSLPTARTKPWGTGHALWCARDELTAPFAVLNADDFYGPESIRILNQFLSQARFENEEIPTYAMVAFKLGNTLSEYGTVSRGLCNTSEQNWLASIEETTGISSGDVGPGQRFHPDLPVSMNCWGFFPGFLKDLDRLWNDFLSENSTGEKAEFYLPFAVDQLLQEGKAKVQLLHTTDQWFGVTYKEDKPRVQAALAHLVEKGQYPDTSN